MKSETLKLVVLTAVVAIAMPELSFAAASSSIGAMMEEVSDNQLASAPKLVSVAAYVIGGIMLLSGALSLKKHAENPASEPLGKGLGRLLVGGGITALPAMLALVQTSSGFDAGAEGAAFKALEIN